MNLSEQDRVELHAAFRSEGYDGSVSSRAQIVLWYSGGYRKGDIAAMSGAWRPTVDKWLKRYEELGMEGLVSRTSPGGPRQIPDRIRARVLALTRTSPASSWGISHWTSPEMACYLKRPKVSTYRRPGCHDCGENTAWHPGARARSRSRQIRTSRTRSATSSVSTWTRRRGRWWCRWT
jgi:transposase